MIKVISWEEYQEGIAPLWDTEPDSIPIFNNPYHIIQYPKEQWSTDILVFPIKYISEGETIGWSCIYNISDSLLRSRGFLIKKEYRGHGHGHKMHLEMEHLFPIGFFRSVIFCRDNTAPGFIKHGKMRIVPGTDWIWSEYSKMNLLSLYRDRGPKPTDHQLQVNREFIRENRAQYSFGGTNNLDVDLPDEEWAQYFQVHAGNYPDLNIDLSFQT